jgi:hypothetical protein
VAAGTCGLIRINIGAGCAKAEVTTVDEVAIREAEIRVDLDGVQVSPPVPALETEQARAMRWGVASMEELCNRALSECVKQGGTRVTGYHTIVQNDEQENGRFNDKVSHRTGNFSRCE